MLPLKDAARRLGISRSKLYEKVSRREIVHYRIDSKILFAEADIEMFLAECRVEKSEGSTRPPATRSRRLKNLSLD
jgi:excisionase family DNA binding protein